MNKIELKTSTQSKMKIDEVKFFDDHVTVLWTKAGVGFGQFSISYYLGKCYIDNEYMSKDFLKEALAALIDGAVLNDTVLEDD